MIKRRFLLGIPLLALALVSAGAFAVASDETSSSGVQPDQTDHVVHGPLGGAFNLPTLDDAGEVVPGRLTGVCFSKGDVPTFELRAKVLPGGPNDPGTLVGKAKILRGPHAGDLVRLRGTWVRDEHRYGRFVAVLKRQPASGGAPEPFVRLHGSWADLHGPNPVPGSFQGRWVKLP